MSDGEDHEEMAVPQTMLATKCSYLYIGMGTDKGVPIPVYKKEKNWQ